MTDAQMLHNLLAVYEFMARMGACQEPSCAGLKEVIAELRRRIALEGSK